MVLQTRITDVDIRIVCYWRNRTGATRGRMDRDESPPRLEMDSMVPDDVSR
jgi:hypothetical protein